MCVDVGKILTQSEIAGDPPARSPRARCGNVPFRAIVIQINGVRNQRGERLVP